MKVSFDPTTYTVTEGVDESVELMFIRSGNTRGSTTVIVTDVPGTVVTALRKYMNDYTTSHSILHVYTTGICKICLSKHNRLDYATVCRLQ